MGGAGGGVAGPDTRPPPAPCSSGSGQFHLGVLPKSMNMSPAGATRETGLDFFLFLVQLSGRKEGNESID